MLLFVYGTLRKGFAHAMAKALNNRSEYIGYAWIHAQLYDLGMYPGIVLSTQEKHKVFGDLYELKDLSFLSDLDDYEGEQYKKTTTKVYCKEKIYQAHVYELCIPCNGFTIISSGDYITYLK